MCSRHGYYVDMAVVEIVYATGPTVRVTYGVYGKRVYPGLTVGQIRQLSRGWHGLEATTAWINRGRATDDDKVRSGDLLEFYRTL